jgi:hypothetical protein
MLHKITSRKWYVYDRILQYCGSEIFITDPGSEFYHPGSSAEKILDPGSGSSSKSLNIFNPKKLFLSSRKNDLGCSSRIRIFSPYRIRIPSPGVKKITGSRIRNTAGERTGIFDSLMFLAFALPGTLTAVLFSRPLFQLFSL